MLNIKKKQKKPPRVSQSGKNALYQHLPVGVPSLNLRDGEFSTRYTEPSKAPRSNMCNEKRAPGCLGYIGDYTTQLYRNYNIPLLGWEYSSGWASHRAIF